MNDRLLTAIDKNNNIRVKVVYAKNLVQTAHEMHNTSPVASAALGRTLVMSTMMSSSFKNENDKGTVIIKGDGPLGGIVTTFDSKLNVKGYVYNPDIDILLNEKGKLDVRKSIGTGYLTVIKDLGLKEPYSGRIDLISGEIAEDFTYYYTKSEQIPSAIGLGVLVGQDENITEAGGFWISVLPDCDEEVLSTIEKNISTITSVTDIYKEGKTCEDFLNMIFEGLEYKILDEKEPKFLCDCSKEKISSILATLSKKDLQDIIENDKKAEINCQFCNKKYTYDEEELRKIYLGGSESDN